MVSWVEVVNVISRSRLMHGARKGVGVLVSFGEWHGAFPSLTNRAFYTDYDLKRTIHPRPYDFTLVFMKKPIRGSAVNLRESPTCGLDSANEDEFAGEARTERQADPRPGDVLELEAFEDVQEGGAAHVSAVAEHGAADRIGTGR